MKNGETLYEVNGYKITVEIPKLESNGSCSRKCPFINYTNWGNRCNLGFACYGGKPEKECPRFKKE